VVSSRAMPERHSNRLIIKVDGRFVFLNPREIDWIEADDKYVRVHTGKDTYLLRKTLSAIETELDPKRFIRIHRSTIVNVDRIKELQPSFSGRHAVLMENGARLTLSRNYKVKLFGLLGRPI
jgi:two-component system LytT family response regulator